MESPNEYPFEDVPPIAYSGSPCVRFEVQHMDPMDAIEWSPVDHTPILPETDADGHHVLFQPDRMFSQDNSIEVLVARGISWQRAAYILRKLADLMNQNGPDLTTLAEYDGVRCDCGHFTADGGVCLCR